MNTPHYKRGTITIRGKQYGRLPDGTLYRIFSTSEQPFLQWVDCEGATFLRVRQATEQGYTDCQVWGCVDLAYPNSQLRRARTVGGGILVNALTCSHQLCVVVEL